MRRRRSAAASSGLLSSQKYFIAFNPMVETPRVAR